jgi:glycosyltransferase involved in cell wall biosynthesis
VTAKVTYCSGSSPNKCRILYLVGQLGCGGSERQLSYFLRAINRLRYPSHLLVWNYSPDDRYVEEIRSLGVPIHSFPRGSSSIAKLSETRRLASLLRPELIHSFSFFTNFPAYWAAFNSNAVALGSLRGEFAKSKEDTGPLIGRLSARWPRFQICNSAVVANAIKASGELWSPLNIDVVRNGLDMRQFDHVPQFESSKPLIVGVGSLLPLKRWDRILRIFQRVRAQGYECRLIIAGDGTHRPALERQSRELGLDGHSEFIGVTSDVPELLMRSRLLVHASETEGCPNVVMEAMACGRPVVAMEAGDIPLLVEDGKTGYVIRQGDQETFGQRVIQLLSDEALCRRMGQAARKKAEREFGLERLVAETLAAYEHAGWKDRDTHFLANPSNTDPACDAMRR